MGKQKLSRVTAVRLDDDLIEGIEDYVARKQAAEPDGTFNPSTFIRSAVRMKLARAGSQAQQSLQRRQGAA